VEIIMWKSRHEAIADGAPTAYSFNCIQFDPFSGHRRLEYPMGRDDHTTAAADCLTLVMPLQARAGMSTHDFYEYWLNAHVTLPARFPGISSIWLHAVSFDDAIWPRLPGVSHRPPPEDEFQGVPEATFVTLEAWRNSRPPPRSRWTTASTSCRK
jgi:hypothetical protein